MMHQGKQQQALPATINHTSYCYNFLKKNNQGNKGKKVVYFWSPLHATLWLFHRLFVPKKSFVLMFSIPQKDLTRKYYLELH